MNGNIALLVEDLVNSALEVFDDHDCPLPECYEDFARCMWVCDMHMNEWQVTREEYEYAMQNAYHIWRHRPKLVVS
jgi:hypothetical protein